MAWFKKERKPRTTSERVKLEIPADAWEKCEECGHIDIKERFVLALDVSPICGAHRRISAQAYVLPVTDEASWREVDEKLRSPDPLHFKNYREHMPAALKTAGPLQAIRAGFARLDGLAINLGV